MTSSSFLITYYSTTLIGGFILIFGTYLSSLSKDARSFMFLFSMSFGLGKGFLYPTALEAAWSHLPGRKGFVTGMVTSGMGFGGFIFGIVATKIINPDNAQAVPTIVALQEDGTPVYEYYFPESVNAKVPFMIQTLCIIWGF
jgi:hypothetical protein